MTMPLPYLLPNTLPQQVQGWSLPLPAPPVNLSQSQLPQGLSQTLPIGDTYRPTMVPAKAVVQAPPVVTPTDIADMPGELPDFMKHHLFKRLPLLPTEPGQGDFVQTRGFETERPKTIAVIGSHQQGDTTKDIDGDGRNDLTDLEWTVELVKAQQPQARVIEYAAPKGNPESIGQQIDALNADLDKGLTIDDVILPLREMVPYKSVNASGVKAITPANIAEVRDKLEPDKGFREEFGRFKAVTALLEGLANRVKVHIPGGDNLGFRDKNGNQTHFNLWSLVKGAKHYKSVNENGQPEAYTLDNTLLNAESDGDVEIHRYESGYDINDDGRVDIYRDDPRLSGHRPLSEKFAGRNVNDVVATPEELAQIRPFLDKPLDKYAIPISPNILGILHQKLVPVEALVEVGRLPAENKDTYDVVGPYVAVGEEGLLFGFRTDDNDRIIYRPFKHRPLKTDAPTVNFMLGSDIAAVMGIDRTIKKIYHG